MVEKEILKKIVAGEYFKEGAYFTEEQLEHFRYFVQDLRVIIEKNRDYYFDTIKNLIDSSDIRKIDFGICFLRCYLDKEEIYLCTLLKYLLHHVVPDVLSNGPEMRSGSDSETIGFQRVSQSVVG